MKKNITICIMLTLMSALWSIESNAQVTNPTNNWSSGAYSGWNTANNLDFKLGTTPTIFMQLIPATGDLNLVNGTSSSHQNAYQIGGLSVLWHNGDQSSIFVGVGAGDYTVPYYTSGLFNTFLG